MRLLCVVMMMWSCGVGAAEPLEVTLDISEVPELQGWGDKMQKLVIAWHPRICNLLPTANFVASRKVGLKIKKSDKGVAATVGNNVVVQSGWIKKHPDDFGVAIHELVHVIQGYKGHGPGWVTEGIADYIRWAIFEGKQLERFPRPKNKPQAYKGGYQTAAGFFLWLERGHAPGIVNKLNSAIRNKQYSDAIFQNETGNSLDELWHEYVAG